MMSKGYRWLDIFILSSIAALLYIPGIGNCHLFDWDEVNFAECAREMLVSGNYSQVQLNFRPFWEKPPLFIWLQAISMNLFGINEFAARFPNALCSIITLSSLYLIGERHYSRRFAWIWSSLYLCSLLPHFYFKTGIIDPWFNLFIFLSLYQFFVFQGLGTGKMAVQRALLSGLFLGLAVLTKGPAALVIAAMSVLIFLIWMRQLKTLIKPTFLLFVFSTLFVSASWFIVEWLKGNGQIIQEFIDYQLRLAETKDAGHGGPFIYHFVVLLLGCFPASLLFLIFYKNKEVLPNRQNNLRRLMISLFWTVLIIFSIIETKIVHYSSLCYFPITYVGALAVFHLDKIKYGKTMQISYWFTSSILGLAALLLSFMGQLIPILLEKNLIADQFARENLKATVHWSGWEGLIGISFIIGAILIHHSLKNKNLKQMSFGLIFNLLFIVGVINVIIPKAEMYTQGAAIAFYEEAAKHDCNIETHAFKSYAYIFYSQRRPEDYQDPEQKRYIEEQLDVMVSEGHSRIKSFSTANQLWMEHGIINKPSYVVVKIGQEKQMLPLKNIHKLYDQNGYSFFVRMPEKSAK